MSELKPAEAGYYFPAEFALHTATWLSWPHNPETWPGKIETVYKPYAQFIKTLIASEFVHINVADAAMETSARNILTEHDVAPEQIKFFHHLGLTPLGGNFIRGIRISHFRDPNQETTIYIAWD